MIAMELRAYISLFKLRICGLITFSAIVGYIAALPSTTLSFYNIVLLTVATMLAAMSASAFNHYFERDIDAVMNRTRSRPLVIEKSLHPAVVIAIALGLLMVALLLSVKALNYMVALHLGLGAFVYAVIYTVWLKRRSWLNIIIGGLAGSFAVLAGGASASPELCMQPVLLAIVMFFWTPSHFWSFAILHAEDYRKAGIPMLPVVIGYQKTALYIMLNSILLVLSSLLPFILGYNGLIYLVGAVVSGAYLLRWNGRLLNDMSQEILRKNFMASMVYLAMLFGALIVDTIVRYSQ